jgi:hypothetical protein
MPIVPLYRMTDDLNAYRRVQSPGGYECWQFEVEAENRTHLLVTFAEGAPWDAEYRRRYCRYHRNPTRHPPPLPRDHAGVVCTGSARKTFRCGAPSVSIADDGSSGRFGSNAFAREPGGRIRVTAENFQLVFVPVSTDPPIELALRDGHEEHHCVVAARFFEVDGSAHGTGHAHHRWGTAPPSRQVEQQIEQWLIGLRAGGAGGTL